MKVLVTGAGGFVGGHLLRRLVAEGHDVVAATGPGTRAPEGVPAVPLEVTDDGSVAAAIRRGVEAIIHLAAISSGPDARRSPGVAWEVNAAGTARVASAAAEVGARLLLVSTAEVYGRGTGPRREEEAPAPISAYAASKLGAEIAAQELWRRAGLGLVIARPFPHTGPGQDTRFVATAFARRIREAQARGESTIRVGNLDPVRDVLHVADVVDAYVRLLDVPADGTVYNIASGRGVSIRELFDRLVRLAGATLTPSVDPELVRAADLPELIGDATRLHDATGWRPAHELDDALREVLRAQAD